MLAALLAPSRSGIAQVCRITRQRIMRGKESTETVYAIGHNLEHNFGGGKQTSASVLVVLNLLAFGSHTAAMLAVLAWRQAVIACGAM